jgi:uroporphyrinogen decarboxylase
MTATSHRFIAACHRQPVDKTPIWLMRQAGRYQASYRAIRQRTTFNDLCRSPELIAQVTTAPIDEFGFDAAILFSDILVACPAMGLELSFAEGGPSIANPVRDRSAIEALRIPEPERDLRFVADGIRATRSALNGRVPLIGFVGGPFTVASYVVEGGSQGFVRLKSLLYADPEGAKKLFDKLTESAIRQLQAQIAAGAEAVQIFESWLGELGREDLETFSLPYLARIAEALNKSGVPRIIFSTGTGAHLEKLGACGYDVVSVDWRVPIAEARARLPAHAVQGNLDPVLLLGPQGTLVDRARDLARQGATTPGFIFNLGHGILPPTPTENVRALVDAVHAG